MGARKVLRSTIPARPESLLRRHPELRFRLCPRVRAFVFVDRVRSAAALRRLKDIAALRRSRKLPTCFFFTFFLVCALSTHIPRSSKPSRVSLFSAAALLRDFLSASALRRLAPLPRNADLGKVLPPNHTRVAGNNLRRRQQSLRRTRVYPEGRRARDGRTVSEIVGKRVTVDERQVQTS